MEDRTASHLLQSPVLAASWYRARICPASSWVVAAAGAVTPGRWELAAEGDGEGAGWAGVDAAGAGAAGAAEGAD